MSTIFKENSIESFRREYAFLSNFYYSNVPFDNKIWKSAEHAYQAAKTFHQKEKDEIYKAPSSGIAKSLGKHVNLRSDWDDVKLSIMKSIVLAKFESNPVIKQKLIDTHPYILIEGNSWHDNFFGVCKCEKCENLKVKHNHLGFILMELRTLYINENIFFKE